MMRWNFESIRIRFCVGSKTTVYRSDQVSVDNSSKDFLEDEKKNLRAWKSRDREGKKFRPDESFRKKMKELESWKWVNFSSRSRNDSHILRTLYHRIAVLLSCKSRTHQGYVLRIALNLFTWN